MLSNEEQAAFLESVERVRHRAVDHLNSVRDVSSAVSFVANLHRGVDEVAQQAIAHGLKTDCKAGCAYCCSVRVEATEPEVFRIAREVKKRPINEVNALVERIKHRVAAAEAIPMKSIRTNCVFLEKDLCSIYEVRPAACRKAHSLSVECCKNFAPEIPQSLEILLGAEALMKGTSDAYRQASLHASAHELGGAILLALTDETAETRWYNGEAVFPEPRTVNH